MSTICRSTFRLTRSWPQVVGLLFLLAVAVLAFAPPVAAANADLILINGKVLTVDKAFSAAEAVAVKGGRIVAVGKTADIVAREKGPQTQVIDLKGRTMLPGLIDSHCHPLGAALSELESDFTLLHTFEEIRAYIRTQAAKTPKGQWISVPKTFPARLKELRMPDRTILDATLDHPVYYDASYAFAVNSYAIKMSGITKDTPSEDGARVLKDAHGEPTGIMTGRASALLKNRPRSRREFTEQEQLDALAAMLKRYAAAGETSITDRGANGAIALYAKLKEQNKLAVRVTMTYRPSLEELQKTTYATEQGDEWVKFGAFKVGLDGGINAGTSFMREPWLQPYALQLFGIPDSNMRGDLRMSVPDLNAIMKVAWEKGWPLCAHSQGSAATDALLDVFEAANKVRPIAPSRSHVVHASFLTPDIIERAKRLGVLFDVQPDWYHFDAVAMSKVVSPEVMRYFNPYQSLVKAGIIFAGGSDHMVGWDKNASVNAYNIFLGMWTAISRKTAQGTVIHPEEKLTREQALRMYTIWGAYLNHNEKNVGSIETGKLADFVVVDKDYLTCPEDEIRTMEPLLTIVGGKISYSAPTAPKVTTH